MNSLDTNILVYAVNSGCVEHGRAKKVYEQMLTHPDQWIVSDQVLFEFYRALRNHRILEHPLGHEAALQQIKFLREQSGVQHCAYEVGFWNSFIEGFGDSQPRTAHIFDRILAVTLKQHGVTSFYTRNTRDFLAFGFKSLVNPIDQT